MEFKKSTVEELIEQDVIEKPMDGNHGSIHPKTKDFTDVGIPFITAADIHSDKVDIEKANKLSEKDAQKLKKGFAKKRDVLLTHKASVGRTAVVNNMEYDYIILSPQVTYYRIKDTTTLLPEYLYLYFKSNYFNQIINQWAGGSTRKYIGITAQKKLPILYPSIKNQKKIVDFIMTFEYKVQVNKKIIANLEELSQTLFKRWFVDFEFPDENGNPYKSSGGEMVDSELGEIPRSWKVDELGNYIKIKSGKRPKNKVDKKDIENVVPIIGASKIMGYTNDYLYNEKIIIIGRVGTHGVIQRFSTRTWPSDNTFVITSDFESIIYQVLKSIDYISLNRGSTQPLLSQKDIKNTKVVMPTNATLLSKYQKENNHILKMMDQKNIENQKLAQLRDTLLPKLMSGEIEIPDDIEVMEDELSI
ncbi:restriction endonuclease subunit S [Staphylococcus pseudintermedius]|uniref:restriction endonuclease subunit S n=1 Tax=Staphylococcus pseudintermedius TaxID=283734 RepID=UPI0029286B52|nr:restriction endonuclease subunit S [Staphylococcus pseudintermedius]MDU9328967.1 restriction endonuclease subunit S [Staphylococcus pseudintermedius]